MSVKLEDVRPVKGLLINHTQDEKFKVETIVVRFITPLDEKMSQKITTLVSLMSESNSKYPDKAELAKKLAYAYGASLHSFSYRMGDSLVSGITINSIADRFVIDGENVSEQCAQLILDCIFEPDIKDGKFSELYFESKKRELIDNIKNQANNRHAYAVKRAREIAFENEPAQLAALGGLEDAQNLTNEDLVEAYSYLLKNAFISITFCGGGTNLKAQKIVTDKFTEFAKSRGYDGEDIKALKAPSPKKNEPKTVREEIEQKQSKLVMIYKTKGENLTADKLACAVLGGTYFSKLFVNVREKMSLCYYCQSTIIDCKNAMLIDSGVAEGDEEKARNEIVRQLELLQKGEFTDEELEDTKRYLQSTIRSSYDSVEDLNSWYFTSFSTGEKLKPSEMIEKIEKITREQVIDSANGFVPDTVYTLVPGGEKEAEENGAE